MMFRKAYYSAWQRMSRLRHCPSIKILQSGSAAAKRHLESCSNCRSRLESAREATALGALLRLSKVDFKETAPAPGDVRALRPANAPAEWVDEEGTFYNPPLLFVLTDPDAQKFVRVAQVFDDPALQGDGDIPLREDMIAEAWNVFSVPSADLDTVAYTVFDASLAERVLARTKQLFADIDENSPLFYFRLDECKTGSFFGMQLTMRALEQWEEEEEFNERVAAFAVAPTVELDIPEEELLSSKKHLASRLLEYRDGTSAQVPSYDLGSAGLAAGAVLGAFAPTASLFKGIPSAIAYAAAASLGSLGRGKNADVRQHKLLLYPEKDAPCWLPVEAQVRKIQGNTMFSIACKLPGEHRYATVGAFYDGQDAKQCKAAWLEGDVLQINAVFAGELSDIDPLLVAVGLFSK